MTARKCMTQKVLRSVITGAVLAGALIACPLPSAQAQVVTLGPSARSSAPSGGVSDRDLTALVETLRLDAQQEELIRALHEGHRAAWTDARREHRETTRALLETAREQGEFRTLGLKLRDAEKQWKQIGEALEEDFFNSVKSLVSDEQLAAWPRFERDRRRRTLLAGQSRLSGEGVDLIDVAESIDLSPELLDHLQTVSDLYATEVDQALAERTRAIEAVNKQMSPAAEGAIGEIDFEALEGLQSKLHNKRLAVRDLNERYAALFEGQLGQDDADDFRQEYRRRSFPGVYRPTAADHYLGAVEGLATLNDEQKRALAGLEGEYSRQAAFINDQLAEIIRTEEEERQEQGMFLGGGGGMGFGVASDALEFHAEEGERGERAAVFLRQTTTTGDGGGQPPLRAAQAGPQIFSLGLPPEDEDSPRGRLNRSKRDLISRTIESAHALLTPDQQALAPKPDERQRLSPEERGRLRMREALEGAVIHTTSDGEETSITITIDPSDGG